ncbi:uncharacterized protein BXZ73DRAFT_76880 [Epithele typhae]|uniref:uncharacterized protein n=1 Tax=Epithele typhae TaxID=378194 RepID=UPI002007C733|nr:uncharacterized protein BXZ73DRAFT_76880 [Epithele typhae]KAH9935181.1 hypothetical protein BXZ73DRAFT_76880 [Epithele typhae]
MTPFLPFSSLLPRRRSCLAVCIGLSLLDKLSHRCLKPVPSCTRNRVVYELVIAHPLQAPARVLLAKSPTADAEDSSATLLLCPSTEYASRFVFDLSAPSTDEPLGSSAFLSVAIGQRSNAGLPPALNAGACLLRWERGLNVAQTSALRSQGLRARDLLTQRGHRSSFQVSIRVHSGLTPSSESVLSVGPNLHVLLLHSRYFQRRSTGSWSLTGPRSPATYA